MGRLALIILACLSLSACGGGDMSCFLLGVCQEDEKQQGGSSTYLSNLRFTPAQPRHADTVEATVQAIDERDAPFTLSYQWSLNGELVSDVTGPVFPARRAIRGNLLSLTITARDDRGKSRQIFGAVTYVDTPPVIGISDLPEEVAHGETVNFTITLNDDDGDPASRELLFGPQGMTIAADGSGSWTPSMPMINRQIDVHFGYTFAESPQITATSMVRVVKPTDPWPHRHAGIQVPYKDNSLWVGDFSGDGLNEILSGSRQGVIQLLAWNELDEIYEQRWVYPFALPNGKPLVQVIPIQADDDPALKILAASGDSVFLISDLHSEAIKLYQAEYGTIQSMALYQDADTARLGLLLSGGPGTKVDVIDAFSAEQIQVFSARFQSTELLVGNLDDDPALEWVTNRGNVFDDSTGEQQWDYVEGFGTHITLADINGDGVQEIASTRYPTLVFSALTEGPPRPVGQEDVCSVQAYRAEGDDRDSLVVGGCQLDGIRSYRYDSDSDAFVSDFNIASPEYGASHIALGDSDNDGVLNFLWVTDSNSEVSGVLVVADPEADPAVRWYNRNPGEQRMFGYAGSAEVVPDQQANVFVAAQVDNGYGNRRVLLVDDNGLLIANEAIPVDSSHVGGGRMAVTDMDQDGIAELFVGARAVNLNDYLVSAQAGRVSADIHARKINDNESIDMIGRGPNTLWVWDLIENALIWESPVISGGTLAALHVADLSGDGFDDLVTSNIGGTYVFTGDGLGGFSQTAQTGQRCEEILTGQFNRVEGLDILCRVYRSHISYQAEITIFDSGLNQTQRYFPPYNPHDMVAVPTGRGYDNVLMLGGYADIEKGFNGPASLVMMDAMSGALVWHSHSLLGNVTPSTWGSPGSLRFEQHNGASRVLVGTSEALYISR